MTGEPQSLVKSAVKSGVFLTVKSLEQIQSMLGYKLPDKGQGSGKNGALVKLDHAKCLVDFLWPGATPDEKKTHGGYNLRKNSISCEVCC